MLEIKSFSLKDPVQNWILLGMPVLSIVGCFMHYIYEWSGRLTIAGIFAPTNESIWEHLKLTFWPMFIWWFIGYCLISKHNKISASQYFVSFIIAAFTCPLVITSFYYTYTGATGIESLILDIFSLFLGIALAQGFAHHLYQYAKFNRYCLFFAFAAFILLAAAFIIFTFTPPHIPLFLDSLTAKYGI